MTNSRQKGKRIEREAVALLKSWGYDTRRGQQYRGGSDSPDVIIEGVDIHIEVKGNEQIDIGTKALDDACEQANRESGGKPWVVLWKKNRTGWRITTDLLFPYVRTTIVGEINCRIVISTLEKRNACP